MVGAGLGGCEATRGVAEMADLATKPGEPKPFVTETRPQDPKYIPIGTTVSRPAKRKTVDEFKKLEPSWKPSESPTTLPAHRRRASARSCRRRRHRRSRRSEGGGYGPLA
jgi:hypothetical protein